jgi:NMD protein affecting ribosome stability and mRNA decay
MIEMLTLICPKCGTEVEKEKLIAGLCTNCYFKGKEIVTLKLEELKLCKSCGRTKLKYKWIAFSEDEIEKIIKDALKVDADEYKIKDIDIKFIKKQLKVRIDLEIKIDNNTIPLHKEYIIKLEGLYCDDCYKTISDFFNVVLQIRYSEEAENKYKKIHKITDFKTYILNIVKTSIKDSRKNGDFLAAMQKTEDTKNGFDIYLASKQLGMEILRNIKAKFLIEQKTSLKLVGIDNKKREKIRYTYLVRLKTE